MDNCCSNLLATVRGAPVTGELILALTQLPQSCMHLYETVDVCIALVCVVEVVNSSHSTQVDRAAQSPNAELSMRINEEDINTFVEQLWRMCLYVVPADARSKVPKE